MDSSAVLSLAEEVLAGLRFAYDIKDTPYREALLSAIRETNQRISAALPMRHTRPPTPSRPPTCPTRPPPSPPEEEEVIIGIASTHPQPPPPYRTFMAAISPLVRGNLTEVGNLWKLCADVEGTQERIDWAKDYIRSCVRR
jgi:hypothetical protein